MATADDEPLISPAEPWKEPGAQVSPDGHWWRISLNSGWARMPHVDAYGRAWNGLRWLAGKRPGGERWLGPAPDPPALDEDSAHPSA